MRNTAKLSSVQNKLSTTVFLVYSFQSFPPNKTHVISTFNLYYLASSVHVLLECNYEQSESIIIAPVAYNIIMFDFSRAVIEKSVHI